MMDPARNADTTVFEPYAGGYTQARLQELAEQEAANATVYNYFLP